MIPTREQAWQWLCEYNDSESLRKHALTAEGVMRHFATLYPGEDPELWGVVGLLHDLDYEKYPDQHCHKAQEILREKGADEVIIRGVASHGYGLCCDIEPVSTMEKVLFTIDELSGLITAAVLMRPSRSVMDIELKSVKKKFKDKRFAAGVNREVVLQGAERLGMEMDAVITETIKGMQKVADVIGLAG
ncbi:MAG: hydrolase [Angelakisella sp.]|jgi:predicted hydrolase (HD superfamily)|nr:hydrolase [Angelakisella sp.]